MNAPAQVQGLSTPEDLAAAGDYDPAAQGGIEITLMISPDGMMTISGMGGEPVPAETLDEALGIIGSMAQEAVGVSQEGAPPEGGEQMDPQAIWDELAAQRPQRGNTV